MSPERFQLARRIRPFYWFSAAVLLTVALWTVATGTLLSKPGGDAQIDYLPSRVFSSQMFRAGALPIWDPHIFSGMPHLAVVQAAAFYPPNIVMYLLLPPTVAFNLSAILHFLLLLGFSHAYFRLFTERDEAAWLGAVAFSFCGYITLHYESTAFFNSATWIPPFFFCLEKWIRTQRWRYCALGGLVLALQLLAGWPQIVLLSAIYGAIYLIAAWREARNRTKLWAGFLIMGLLSAGIGASVVLPTLEFKKYSNLADLPYAHFISLSIAPQTLVQLLFPYIMGADWLRFHRVPYFGSEQMAVGAMYLGILPLMLAAAALVFWRTSRLVRFAAISSVVALVLAFGGYTPIGRVLFRIPLYNFFRDHRVHLVFLAFFVATLAAWFAGNFERLTEPQRRRLARTVPLGFIALAILVLVKIRAILGSIDPAIAPLDGLWIVRLHQIMRFGNPDMLIALATLFVSAVLFWRWMLAPNSRMLARLAIALVFTDLLWFGATDQPLFASNQPSEEERAISEAATRAERGQPYRAMAITREHPFLQPNLNLMSGVDQIFGYTPLVPGRYSDLLQNTEIGDSPWRETLTNNAILSLLNTRIIFATAAQWQSIQSIYGDDVSHEREKLDAEPVPSQDLLDDSGWKTLSPGEKLDPAAPFSCSRPPCGMKYTGLLLNKNSVYQLRFTLRGSARHNPRLEVWVANPAHWRPREMFRVSNVMITAQPTPYVFTYVTAGEDEPVDLRFATADSSPLRLSAVSLVRAAMLRQGTNPYREIAQSGDLVALENTKALPRAFFVSQITGVRDYYEARTRLWDAIHPFDPEQEALVEGDRSLAAIQLSPGEVQRLEYQSNRAFLDVTCGGRCYLVLADLDLPGWRATIDGQPAEIHTTDVVVRGVFVPSGRHRLEFVYRPAWLTLALTNSLVTLLISGLIIWRSRES